ncbi:MAG: efflux RND transporter periplasmic adaptor subunit [Desulfobacteraceae bacterium]|nr:efflux RND transporter periplasmic adaptor subunit [Pseudomonadota bacterium]MBU4463762.1 efflux RND transporter periplasmic adaptor subunit [Pseudomonadota bacterium]MCG2754641.1 efflux RND transporter periplasmic adaptor subunit [Desulfobacteraceae bacterium]
MKKFFVIIIVLAGLGFLGWQIYQKASDSSKGFKRERQNVPVAVEVVLIKKASIRQVGSFTGSLYPFSEFILAPKIAGRLEKILVHIGDTVKGGQLVAILDDDEYRQQVSQATAEMEVAQANLQERKSTIENAKREYERTVALRKKKIISESQIDAAESEFKTQQAKLEVAVAQLSQKKAALKIANIRLSYAQIQVTENNTAGYRVVGERFVDEGAMLAPNTPIVSILDIGKLIAAIHVIERDYPKIQLGMEAIISTDAFPGHTFNGKVIRIAPLLKEKSRQARVEIEIPNAQKLLKPGMFVRVHIQFDEHENVTVVPIAAIVKRNGTQGVFLADLKEQKARFVPVTVGIVNSVQAEVLDPPITGSVVTLGHHLLEDGSLIILPGKS